MLSQAMSLALFLWVIHLWRERETISKSQVFPISQQDNLEKVVWACLLRFISYRVWLHPF